MPENKEYNTNKPKTVKFFTLGCKVNQYESQAIAEEFCDAGCQLTQGPADLYVINTCTVTARADTKSKDAVRKAKKENARARIAVVGCLASLNADTIREWGVDYVVPQGEKSMLVDRVLERMPQREKDIWALQVSHGRQRRAFVKIQDGCANFCSFCKIPYLRGPSQSRPIDDVIDEVKRLSCRYAEVVLCGVNVGLYGKDSLPPSDLGGLLTTLLRIPTVQRLRLSSLEPPLITEEVLSLLQNLKLCPHLHLPFQSGDDRILKAMNKSVTAGEYIRVVEDARRYNPGVAISCDIMVGFPGEDDESFSNTLTFLRTVAPMRMHVFTFSPREKTPLADKRVVNTHLVRQRYNTLIVLGNELAQQYRERFLGKTVTMVVEEKRDGYWWGYSEQYLRVKVKQELLLGTLVPVRIESIEGEAVIAQPV